MLLYRLVCPVRVLVLGSSKVGSAVGSLVGLAVGGLLGLAVGSFVGLAVGLAGTGEKSFSTCRRRVTQSTRFIIRLSFDKSLIKADIMRLASL